MEMVAAVLIDESADRVFSYRVPESLRGRVRESSRVAVPLRGREATGTVLELMPRSESGLPAELKLKEVRRLLAEDPLLTTSLLRLARWISRYYRASLAQTLRCMVPSAVRPESGRARTRRIARLAKMPSEAERQALAKRAPRQAAIVDALLDAGGSAARLPAADFPAAALASLAGKGLVAIEVEEVGRDPYPEEAFVATLPQELTDEQKTAVDSIIAAAAAENPKPILLHGITGSGKTEVYLQSIAQIAPTSGGAIVLVPEISLTPQTVERFKGRFSPLGVGVAVLHSRLSEGERFDEWERIRAGHARIVVGPRSALFAPLEKPGIIIVDEEHETSYKQESAPRYHGRDCAVMRARIEGCVVVLGSATPSLESYANALNGKYSMNSLTRRVDDRTLPLVRVVDMRIESRKQKGVSILSTPLRNAMEHRLERREQTILFLNRRGFARSLQCPACGHAVQCRHCSVALTYHKKDDRLVCHVCGYQERPPKRCSECSDPSIQFAGFGTQRVEEVVNKVFPKARVARLDTDTTRRKNAMTETLDAFRKGALDILIGTQMIAKGLDYPNVTLVGVLSADTGLNMPDFRAGERTFQLLTQVAGRAGRGDRSGEVIVQTFAPHSPAIQFARHHDFLGFAAQEMEFRQAFQYPPYTRAALILARGKQEELTRLTLATLHKMLAADSPPGVSVGEPVPAPLAKAQDHYQFQLLIRAASAAAMAGHLSPALDAFKSPEDVRLTVDIDPGQIC